MDQLRIKYILIRLENISALEANWNNYGAPPITTSIIKKATSYLFELEKKPDIVPTGKNSIQFEFENDGGDYLEIEIFENAVEYLIEIHGEEEDGQIDSINSINQLILRLDGADNIG